MTYPADGFEMIAHCEAEIKSLMVQARDAQMTLIRAERDFSVAQSNLQNAHVEAARTFTEMYSAFSIMLNNTAIVLESRNEKAS